MIFHYHLYSNLYGMHLNHRKLHLNTHTHTPKQKFHQLVSYLRLTHKKKNLKLHFLTHSNLLHFRFIFLVIGKIDVKKSYNVKIAIKLVSL